MADDRDGRFTVRDKRILGPDGKPLAGEAPAAAPREAPRAQARPPADEGPLPPLDFGTIVSLLSTPALVFLGALENPESGKREPNLALAQQQIGLLELLQQKTRGNLAPPEESFLDDVLYQLRSLYVQLAKRK